MIFSRRLLTDLQREYGQQMQLWRKCNKTLLQDIKSPLQLCKRIVSLKLLNACVMKWSLCGLLLPSALGSCVRAEVTCAPHLYLCSRSPMCCFSSFSCTSRWCNFFCSSADCRKETTVQSHIRRHAWDMRHGRMASRGHVKKTCSRWPIILRASTCLKIPDFTDQNHN